MIEYSEFIGMAVMLFGVHFVCDFTLQTDTMAKGKAEQDLKTCGVPWIYWMLAHCFTHALGVYLVTGSSFLANLQLIAHFIIDFLKINKRITFTQDQVTHLGVMLILAFLWSLEN